MPTTDQKADLLFKKLLGKGSSGTGSLYFNEPRDGRAAISTSQIWAAYDSIPITAATVAGVTTQSVDASLTQISGQPTAFYSDALKDAIPFNFDPAGTYVPVVKKADNSVINFGQNDWVIDPDTGMLTFFAGLPAGVSAASPPKVTFWKYVGPKGFSSGSSSIDGGYF